MATRSASFDTVLPGDIRLMNATAGFLATVGVVALLATAVVWVARQPLFALHEIRIEGDVTRNSVSTIRANAVPRLVGSFFTMDLTAGRHAFESVPWVRAAIVRRVWPNRLTVELEEHRAVALWSGVGTGEDADTSEKVKASAKASAALAAESGQDKLVNNFGEVFEANLGDVEDDALPTLAGPDGSSAHMLALLGRLGKVFAPLDARIETLALSGRGSWHVELDTGAEVELGRGSDDEVIARTQRFVGTLTQITQRYQRPLEYADLRHNQGYAVRLKGITTTINATDKPAKK